MGDAHAKDSEWISSPDHENRWTETIIQRQGRAADWVLALSGISDLFISKLNNLFHGSRLKKKKKLHMELIMGLNSARKPTVIGPSSV